MAFIARFFRQTGLSPGNLAGLIALGLALAISPALAQTYPTRPVRMVIAFPPGGPTDFVGRILADKMKDLLGQSVIIENKAGANGAIGADYVAKSEPDGHTVFLTTAGAVTISPGMRNDLPYDTMRDFAPISLVVHNTTLLVVRTEHTARNAGDLVALARQKPGTIAFASTGIGSMPHLALELYQASANVKFLHVPYRGAAQALTDLIGGQVEGMFADAPVLLPQIDGGKIRPLGAAAGTRNPKLPQVPTLAEQGFPDTQADNWYGILAPARTPPAIVARLNSVLTATLNDPAVRAKLIESGAVPAPMTPAEFGGFLRGELARWSRIVRDKNIRE
jgi:tripartite-type tricarboxylate transporter receptor subunit TctC